MVRVQAERRYDHTTDQFLYTLRFTVQQALDAERITEELEAQVVRNMLKVHVRWADLLRSSGLAQVEMKTFTPGVEEGNLKTVVVAL